MISPLPKRSLFNWIVCWQTAHRHEGTEDQHFRCSLSLDAKTWTTHLEIPLRETGIVWSPVLFLLKETLYLFYSESETCLRPAREDVMGRQFPPRWSPGGTIKYVKSIDGIAWTKSRSVKEPHTSSSSSFEKESGDAFHLSWSFPSHQFTGPTDTVFDSFRFDFDSFAELSCGRAMLILGFPR